MERAVLSWSGGKDAAYALARLREADVAVEGLLTTINPEHDRSTMHGVRRSLYERQADALGVPIDLVDLPPEPSNETYERVVTRTYERYRDRGVDAVVFADVALADVRAYREDLLAGTGLAGAWPLWGRDTAALVREVLDAGVRATVVAVDGDVLDPSFAGRALDADFLADLPDGVDPCGEHGEFHTFVWDGPIFEAPVPVVATATVTRAVGDGEMHYADLEYDPDGVV